MLKTNYTDYMITNHILKKAVVLIDTREKENAHIIEWLNKKSILHQETKLSFGDYSLLIPRCEEYGITTDLIIDYAIERKASLEEISGNLTNDRDRIKYEFWRGNGKMDIVIENGSWDLIASGKYNTQYDKNSFIATLITYKHRFNVSPHFVSKEYSAELIYKLLLYKLREELKGD
ncbi:MAG: ERCC4 domain-containing protein [Clostridia bacterium]|jgi:ERCC4-type nuclease|nr:ERCC4 domain-containing protein [Clostridia bacterium]MDD3086222.1 hypothetical protein [Candidatus ainarchaeum sp.]